MPYDPKTTEDRIYQLWLESGFFNPDNLPGERPETFTVTMAPPNITGTLHMGHALENILSDAIVRFERMNNKRVLWLPGIDHAGIATQNVIEKELKKTGLTRQTLGREKFIEKVWEWKDRYGSIILDQLKKLGCSLDWSRARFTMDDGYKKAVTAAFNHYLEKGLIYQGERVINWCVKDQTAISDLEVAYEEENTTLWYIKYPLKNRAVSITVATSRPETMLGDTAVAVNPDDERFQGLVGEEVILPLTQRVIKIIGDRAVDMNFGSGAVKVTPAHDIADSEMGKRHNLSALKIIEENGIISNSGTEFDGLKAAEARTEIVRALKKQGLLEKEERLKHNIARCERCGSIIEPLLSKQWFLKMPPLAAKAIAAIEADQVVYLPARWKKVALDWLRNVKDWCISRQIWWGHPLPIEGSQDTFDTWFSSALWPFAALGWPDKNAPDLKKFYPTNFITSAREIIHLWIARMIFGGLEFMEEVPFSKVFIHATVLTRDGKRMSKSLGTGIDPLRLIEKYGADATRFGLIYQTFGGQDVRFNEDNIKMGQKFANKLWNITRYVLTKTNGQISYERPAADSWPADERALLQKLDEVVRAVTNHLETYEFGGAAHLIYDFIWHELADQYLESTKQKDGEVVRAPLSYTLVVALKLLHPFMPFITEELWGLLPQGKDKKILLVESWP